jgi:hypothetical protein
VNQLTKFLFRVAIPVYQGYLWAVHLSYNGGGGVFYGPCPVSEHFSHSHIKVLGTIVSIEVVAFGC